MNIGMNAILMEVINMKTLTINNRKLEYKLFWHSSEYGDSEWTEFYEGTITETHKKYWLFGKEITTIKPKKVFTIWRNIESKKHTKKEVRDWVQYEVDLLNREDEIRRGEII
jgi:hypothetical protein